MEPAFKSFHCPGSNFLEQHRYLKPVYELPCVLHRISNQLPARAYYDLTLKKPAPKPPSRRVLSPFGAGSTLITSAPNSAKINPAVGPMTVWVNSKTLTPVKCFNGIIGDVHA